MNKPETSLEDVEAIARAHPETFHIASREMRERLRPGDLVKLHFRSASTGRVERMWVETRSVEPDGYWGVLDNDPSTEMGIVCGDPVAFLPHHVSHVWIEADHDWPLRMQGPANVFIEAGGEV